MQPGTLGKAQLYDPVAPQELRQRSYWLSAKCPRKGGPFRTASLALPWQRLALPIRRLPPSDPRTLLTSCRNVPP